MGNPDYLHFLSTLNDPTQAAFLSAFDNNGKSRLEKKINHAAKEALSSQNSQNVSPNYDDFNTARRFKHATENDRLRAISNAIFKCHDENQAKENLQVYLDNGGNFKRLVNARRLEFSNMTADEKINSAILLKNFIKTYKPEHSTPYIIFDAILLQGPSFYEYNVKFSGFKNSLKTELQEHFTLELYHNPLNFETLNKLLKAGVNINAVRYTGPNIHLNYYSILTNSLFYTLGHNNDEAFKWLLKNGANPNPSRLNWRCAFYPLRDVMRRNTDAVDLVDLLIKAGVEVKQKDLDYAILRNHTKVTKRLLETGKVKPGFYHLERAVESNNLELVKALVESCLDLEELNKPYGGSKLLMGDEALDPDGINKIFEKASPEIADYLIKQGATYEIYNPLRLNFVSLEKLVNSPKMLKEKKAPFMVDERIWFYPIFGLFEPLKTPRYLYHRVADLRSKPDRPYLDTNLSKLEGTGVRGINPKLHKEFLKHYFRDNMKFLVWLGGYENDIQKILKGIAQNPADFVNYPLEGNPLEIALLFGDQDLAVALLGCMTDNQRNLWIDELDAKYPHLAPNILKCFFNIDPDNIKPEDVKKIKALKLTTVFPEIEREGSPDDEKAIWDFYIANTPTFEDKDRYQHYRVLKIHLKTALEKGVTLDELGDLLEKIKKKGNLQEEPGSLLSGNALEKILKGDNLEKLTEGEIFLRKQFILDFCDLTDEGCIQHYLKLDQRLCEIEGMTEEDRAFRKASLSFALRLPKERRDIFINDKSFKRKNFEKYVAAEITYMMHSGEWEKAAVQAGRKEWEPYVSKIKLSDAREIPRVLLSIQSPVFEKILDPNTKFKKTDTLELPNQFNEKTISLFVTYLEKGQLEESELIESFEELYALANMYQIQLLTTKLLETACNHPKLFDKKEFAEIQEYHKARMGYINYFKSLPNNEGIERLKEIPNTPKEIEDAIVSHLSSKFKTGEFHKHYMDTYTKWEPFVEKINIGGILVPKVVLRARNEKLVSDPSLLENFSYTARKIYASNIMMRPTFMVSPEDYVEGYELLETVETKDALLKFVEHAKTQISIFATEDKKKMLEIARKYNNVEMKKVIIKSLSVAEKNMIVLTDEEKDMS
jgi:hypothetical protein